MNDLDPIVQEFLLESHENLDQLDRDLVALETAPRDRGRLASIFRTIHTIKGTCGFFGFTKLESVTHVGESLLCRLREGKLLLNPPLTSALLAMVDAVRGMLANIEKTGQEGVGDYGAVIAGLTRAQIDGAAPTAPAAPALPNPVEELEAHDAPGNAVAESNLRVDVSLLDNLMNLVGELVLARNQLLQYTGGQKDASFLNACQRLNLITTELQEGVMKTRMQPIGNVWNKLPRIVRDLALLCGKQVRLEMEGRETELDKTILEAIKDPLTHILRNAVDHGIEKPEVRVARGKPAEGCLSLRAYHESGQVNIEISEDGGGIDTHKVKHKAIERGLITSEQAAGMTERELIHLIFLPGFSTAEQVTNVSGRGVGMDVVKTNIERIGGTLDVQSRPGRGTTLKIKLPLTLAIIPALIVTSGDDRYAIPQVSLLELVRLEGEQARARIEQIHGIPVYRLRGNLLPLVYLHRVLEVEEKRADAVHVVVLQAGERPFGLVVDGVCDTEEIVVKPLGKLLKGIPLYAGATILGDGRVALILDVLGLAQKAHVVSELRERTSADKERQVPGPSDNRQTLLLFGMGRDQRMAVPLSRVARLEEIPRQSVERASGQEVVQYRGDVLPLVRLRELLRDAILDDAPESDTLQVVVYSEQGRCVGLVVDHVLDVLETSVDVHCHARRVGILGSAVIQQRVTDLVDVPAVLRAAGLVDVPLAATV